MKNFVKPGKCITYTNETGAEIPSGQGVVVGDCVFIATGVIEDGKEGELLTEGVVRVAKAAGVALAIGESVSWDDGAKTAGTTGTKMGFCAESAVAGDTSVEVKLWPSI